MRNIKYFLIILILLLLNSCSEENGAQPCPQTENISMKINGEAKQFTLMGRGIDLDRDDSGHTLYLQIVAGVFSPQQDSYSISLKLPYKKTGNNLIEEFLYFRVPNAAAIEGYFEPGELQSNVTVNTKNCISLTFSGSAIIDGNEINISEGIINHAYAYPFDN